jgi:hypothetical protein
MRSLAKGKEAFVLAERIELRVEKTLAAHWVK